jgi:hypothetical protein
MTAKCRPWTVNGQGHAVDAIAAPIAAKNPVCTIVSTGITADESDTSAPRRVRRSKGHAL